MLKRVVISVQGNIIPTVRQLSDHLKDNGVEVSCLASDCSTDVFMREESEETTYSADRQDTLYITDSESAYHALRQQGKYVLPCRHEENRDSDFAGAMYVIEKIEEIDYETVDMAYRRLAGLPWDILTTRRCIVRETTTEDVDSFYRIYAEPEITKYMENLYADRDEEIVYIEDYREKVYGYYGYGMWTVLTKEGTVIGRAGISWREGFAIPELGFVIGVPWQQQGYAHEVCSAILDYARKELGFTQIQALVMEGNDKSERLCYKLGFHFEERITIEDKMHVRLVWQAEMPYCVFNK